ncbi:hypothetical protein TWF173_003801 [Orbilia oligospora]|nr:hypothetical protein TWF173_003801 [Orbilia oligospora]
MQNAVANVIENCRVSTRRGEVLFQGMNALVCRIVKKETPEITITMIPFQRNIQLTVDRLQVPTIPNNIVTDDQLVDYVWANENLRKEILAQYNYVTEHESGKNTKDDTIIGRGAKYNDNFIQDIDSKHKKH